jgi:hypothetical protein
MRATLHALALASVVSATSLSASSESVSSAAAPILRKLHAMNWETRAEALTTLVGMPELLHASNTRRALIELLDRENKASRAPKQSPRSNQDWEAWRQYYDRLLDQVSDLVEPSDVRSVSVLVQSSYNPDSPLALQLASYGETVVPALFDIIAHRNVDGRSDSYEVLGQVLRAHRLGTSRHPLRPRTVHDVESRLRAGLTDPAPVIRGSAIRGVKAAGDAPSLPILEDLQRSDPDVLDGTNRFWIREQAAKAIAAIRANPLTK